MISRLARKNADPYRTHSTVLRLIIVCRKCITQRFLLQQSLHNRRFKTDKNLVFAFFQVLTGFCFPGTVKIISLEQRRPVQHYRGISIQPVKPQHQAACPELSGIQLKTGSVFPVYLIDPLQILFVEPVIWILNQSVCQQVGVDRARDSGGEPLQGPGLPELPVFVQFDGGLGHKGQ
ncbi:hypothetical protein DSECCO2_583370 [anaerobic digester metagenome]